MNKIHMEPKLSKECLSDQQIAQRAREKTLSPEQERHYQLCERCNSEVVVERSFLAAREHRHKATASE